MLVFHDISSFDAENPIVGLLLQELDVAKRTWRVTLSKKASQRPSINFITQNRLNKLRNDRNNNNNDGGLSPPPSPLPFNIFQQQPPPLPPPPFSNFVTPPPPPPFSNFVTPPPPLPPPSLNNFEPLPSPPQLPLPTLNNFTISPPPQPSKPLSFGSQTIKATK